MNLSLIDAFVRRHPLVGLDSMVFIYHAMGPPRYGDASARVLEILKRAPGSGCTSTVSLAEVMVHPLRIGSAPLVARYRLLLRDNQLVALLPITPRVAEQAAGLRAYHGLRLADALQLAAVTLAGATGFITNDASFRRVAVPEVLLLSDVV